MRRRQFLWAVAGTALAASLPARILARQTNGVVMAIGSRGDRLLIPITLARGERHEFVLDTGGAFNLLARDKASQLGAASRGTAKLTVARNRQITEFVEVADLVLGETLAQSEMLFAVVEDVDFGEGAIGSVGAAAVTVLDSVLDPATGRLTLYPDGLPQEAKTGYRSAKALGELSAIGGARHLFIDADVGGQAFRGTVDTGAPTPLRISDKVARAAGIDWTGQNWTPLWVEGKRIVPLLRSPVAVRLGGVEFAAPLLAIDRNASLGLPSDATIGLPLIRALRIAVDAASGDVYTSRADIGSAAPLANYNRAGLFLQQAGADLRVTAVGRGSPAQLLGIEIGDRLKNAELGEFVKWVSMPQGTARDLEIERGGALRKVSLTLADFL